MSRSQNHRFFPQPIQPNSWLCDDGVEVCGDCWPSARLGVGRPDRCDDGNSQVIPEGGKRAGEEVLSKV